MLGPVPNTKLPACAVTGQPKLKIEALTTKIAFEIILGNKKCKLVHTYIVKCNMNINCHYKVSNKNESRKLTM